MPHSNWEKWGRRDPYYGVISHAQYRGAVLTGDTRAEFFKSGEEQIAGVLATAESLFGPLARNAALDYGCGVGRLLLPLSRQFARVQGADIAPSMLAEAGRNCAAAANVSLFPAAEALASADPLNFIHSTIVFQHIPRSEGTKILLQLLRRLAPGGVAAIDLPVAPARDPLHRSVKWLCARLPPAQILVNALLSRPLSDPPMPMHTYPLSPLIAQLHRVGFSRVSLVTRRDRRYILAMLFTRREP